MNWKDFFKPTIGKIVLFLSIGILTFYSYMLLFGSFDFTYRNEVFIFAASIINIIPIIVLSLAPNISLLSVEGFLFIFILSAIWNYFLASLIYFAWKNYPKIKPALIIAAILLLLVLFVIGPFKEGEPDRDFELLTANLICEKYLQQECIGQELTSGESAFNCYWDYEINKCTANEVG